MASKPAGSNQRTIGIIAAIAFVAAAIILYKLWAGTQVQVVRSINLRAGSSEKMQEMKKGGQMGDGGASDNINPWAMRRN